jgi:hypothetical protein
VTEFLFDGGQRLQFGDSRDGEQRHGVRVGRDLGGEDRHDKAERQSLANDWMIWETSRPLVEFTVCYNGLSLIALRVAIRRSRDRIDVVRTVPSGRCP